MQSANLSRLLEQWKEQYQLLLEYSTELLRNFDIYGGDQTKALIARRQKLIDTFQTIDARLAEAVHGQKGWGEADRRLLEEFRNFQELATRKVLALDALVIALAKERMACLRKELAAMTKRKGALSAYEKGRM